MGGRGRKVGKKWQRGETLDLQSADRQTHLYPGYRWVCLAADSSSKVRAFRQLAAASCVVLPTANAGQYATTYCKPLLF